MLKHSIDGAQYGKAMHTRDRIMQQKEDQFAFNVRNEESQHIYERNKFEKNAERAMQANESKIRRKTQELEVNIREKVNDMQQKQLIERDQLDNFLATMPLPRMKLPKSLLELKNTQHNLARLHHFEEARNLSTILEVMEREEAERHEQAFARSKQTRYKTLIGTHEKTEARLKEKSTEKRLFEARRCAELKQIELQRLLNLYRDIEHRQKLEMIGIKNNRANELDKRSSTKKK
uniref:Uncharacterized protein AlNc14C104G6141 n=1 Tax=Albugo laibachii Nc14 TaxID=890382 RepID=F0WHT4_9STRA|nr:conserved hypothetical protein [Albugo laibachii Nc14]|eukprot:CCA20809.1 conserved hypothetical protein [Albugo laibachii Nc14]